MGKLSLKQLTQGLDEKARVIGADFLRTEEGMVKLTFSVTSFAVSSPDISDQDRKKILHVVFEKILESQKYPTIVLCGRIKSIETENIMLSGAVEMHGYKKKLVAILKKVSGFEYHSSFSILQTDYGISPYRALGGLLNGLMLRSSDEVKVRVRIHLPCELNLIVKSAP